MYRFRPTATRCAVVSSWRSATSSTVPVQHLRHRDETRAVRAVVETALSTRRRRRRHRRLAPGASWPLVRVPAGTRLRLIVRNPLRHRESDRSWVLTRLGLVFEEDPMPEHPDVDPRTPSDGDDGDLGWDGRGDDGPTATSGARSPRRRRGGPIACRSPLDGAGSFGASAEHDGPRPPAERRSPDRWPGLREERVTGSVEVGQRSERRRCAPGGRIAAWTPPDPRHPQSDEAPTDGRGFVRSG